MIQKPAPIAFFAFRRPSHTRRALESLSRCTLSNQSHLFIFCDGPRNTADDEVVRETRAVAREKKWCRTVEIIEHKANQGLARSIQDGVTQLCRQFGSVIVLEDDLILAQNFLEFMNQGLERYRNEEHVMQVTGYMYPVEIKEPGDAFFISHASCWGWGTWLRAWEKFESSAVLYERLLADSNLRRRFNMDGSYPYFELLERQRSGRANSWGILWYQTIFLNEGLVLMPKKSLVQNIGSDGSGTHHASNGFQDVLSSFQVIDFPKAEGNDNIYSLVAEHLRGMQSGALKGFMRGLRKLFSPLQPSQISERRA